MKVNLSFNANNNESEINLVWPRGGIKAQLRPKQAKTLIMIPKIRPESNAIGDEEILKLNYDANWKELDKKNSKSKVQVYPLRGSADLKAISE